MEDALKEWLKNKIKELRHRKSYTQEELKTISGVSTDTIKGIEGGNSNPTITTLFKIARAFDLSLHSFFADCPNVGGEGIHSDPETYQSAQQDLFSSTDLNNLHQFAQKDNIPYRDYLELRKEASIPIETRLSHGIRTVEDWRSYYYNEFKQNSDKLQQDFFLRVER